MLNFICISENMILDLIIVNVIDREEVFKWKIPILIAVHGVQSSTVENQEIGTVF